MSEESCYTKAKALGERTFTLRAQDLTAPSTIGEWIKQNIRTAPREKLIEAIDAAIEMREWHNHKWPD